MCVVREVLCIGDSNTWGYNSQYDSRFLWNERWTGRLQILLGEEYHIVENGKCGRTTIFYSGNDIWTSLNFEIENLIRCYSPIDICIIMLGTNDVKEIYYKNASDIAMGLEVIGRSFSKSYMWNETLSKIPKILIVLPPYIENIVNSPFLIEFGMGSETKSRQLANFYERICARNGWYFINSNNYVKVDSLDGVHLNKKGHLNLGYAIYEKIKEMESDRFE